MSVAEQEALLEVLRKRLIDRRRKEIADEVAEARREYELGEARVVTPDELMDELLG